MGSGAQHSGTATGYWILCGYAIDLQLFLIRAFVEVMTCAATATATGRGCEDE